jgi:menaquinone-dependent protoporphyrinogen oxidase
VPLRRAVGDLRPWSPPPEASTIDLEVVPPGLRTWPTRPFESEVAMMSWTTKRVLILAGWLCIGLMAGLTGAIVTVSMLSTRDRISLAGGIAVFVIVVVTWATVAAVLGTRWWRWSRRDHRTSARVLVAYGSRRGSTADLAATVADHLTTAGAPADVRPAGAVARLSAYDAVVLGGALYSGRWHPDARRFVRRHARELRDRPVWLFASGPLEHLASPHELAPVPTIAAAASRIGARDVATFGGRLEPDTPGFVAGRMVAQGRGGDFRDLARIRYWTSHIADELERLEDGRPATAPSAAPSA